MRPALRRFAAHWHEPQFLPVLFGALFAVATVVIAVIFGPPGAALATAVLMFSFWAFLLAVTLKLDASRRAAAIVTQELDGFIAHLRHPIIFYDPNLVILRINRAAEQLFRIEASDVVGRALTPAAARTPQLKVLTEILFPSLAPSVIELSEAGAWPQIVSITVEDPHAEFLTTLHRIVDERGSVVGFLKLIEDRTREQEILRSKTEFITVAAHQLRTPLTAIEWLIDTLASSGTTGTELAKGFGDLKGLAGRTLKIVNDLLDAAKIEEGKFGYRFEDADVVGIVRNAIQAMGTVARESQVRIFLGAAPESYLLRVDPSRIETAFMNMLDNAVKYNIPNGTVTVTVAEEPGGSALRISIEDTGIGVPPEEVQKLFTRLHRASNAQEAEPNGSGLGLYIAKNIVERHGGQVGVASTLGRGSTIWFTLPTDPRGIPEGTDTAGT